ncbi:hypothetical protein ATG_00900 [Desulfurococcaceae archaeon AG1]|jgi:hypothetical protein|nr:hypothetical protein ATG_00900 [Desulfurococcaceae archaeon AG1]
MYRLKKIGVGYFKNRVKKRKIVQDRRVSEARDTAINQEDILKLELETLYMIGAPAS